MGSEPQVGDEVWFPMSGKAGDTEFIKGTVVEDNNSRWFIETYDGMIFDISKQLCRKDKK